MNVYLSASRTDKSVVADFAGALPSMFDVPCKWWTDIGDTDAGVPQESAIAIAESELLAVSRSDVFVYFAPPPGIGRGCHVELGIALGCPEIDVWTVGEHARASIFSALADRHYPTTADALCEFATIANDELVRS